MRIAAVQHVVPTQRITNEWIKREIRRESAGALSGGDPALMDGLLDAAFESAGTRVRYRMSDDENAMDLIAEAGRLALRDAGVSRSDVEFLVYAGVGRGWIEPAMAPAVQTALGLHPATCFDVLDACASWLRALHVAHAFLRSGAYRCGMIVNAECGFKYFADLSVGGVADLESRFATCTIGEAVTATIVTGTSSDDWHFAFGTAGEHTGLCMIPLPGYGAFLRDSHPGEHAPLKFRARSRELLGASAKMIVEVFENDPVLPYQSYDICFGHAASEKAVQVVARRIRQPYDIYFSTHGAYGNTVAASVPLGMSLAIGEGKLQRGAKVLVIVGASGISVGIASFTF